MRGCITLRDKAIAAPLCHCEAEGRSNPAEVLLLDCFARNDENRRHLGASRRLESEIHKKRSNWIPGSSLRLAPRDDKRRLLLTNGIPHIDAPHRAQSYDALADHSQKAA